MSDYRITKLFDFDDDEYTRYQSDDESDQDYEGGAVGTTSSGGDANKKKNMQSMVPPKPQKGEGCCSQLFKKTFTYLFPARAKVCYTKQGSWLRKMLYCAVANHWCFFVFCMYFVGFKSTLSNLLLSFAAYSVALTLRVRLLMCYFCCLLMGAATEIYSDIGKKQDSIQKIGLLVNVCFYGINAFFVGKAFLSFRQTGGLRGDPNDPDFAQNILPEFLVKSAEKAGQIANKKMDKIIEKDKKEDEEAAAFNKQSKQKAVEPPKK